MSLALLPDTHLKLQDSKKVDSLSVKGRSFTHLAVRRLPDSLGLEIGVCQPGTSSELLEALRWLDRVKLTKESLFLRRR